MADEIVSRSGPARKTRGELLSEWRREEVLEAARRIFARLGYAATTVEEIAKEAGMAKGTIYLYFRSKEEVYTALLTGDLEYLANQMIKGMSAAGTFEERLAEFLDQSLSQLRNRKALVSVCCAYAGSRGSRSARTSKRLDRPFFRSVDFMRQCLAQAIADGEISAIPVESAAFSILALARALLERHLYGWTRLAPGEDIAFTHSLIMYGLQHPVTAGNRVEP
jgi:AcrR family transcriptional regulator